jgi:hypothetical protein
LFLFHFFNQGKIMKSKISTAIQVWLTWIFSKAIGICGAGLAAIGISTSHDTPALMAGVTLTALHLALSWWNTRRALKTMPPAPKTVSSWPLRAGVVAAGLGGLVLTLAACSTTGGSTAAGSSTTAAPTTGTASALIEAALPLIRTGASVATGAVLDFAVQQSSTRTRLANEMYAAASAVYSLSGGTFPTTAQFQANILAFGGSQTDASYAQFATAISSLYASYYPKLASGDAKTATDLLNAIAGGIEDATAAYVTVPASGTAVAAATP